MSQQSTTNTAKLTDRNLSHLSCCMAAAEVDIDNYLCRGGDSSYFPLLTFAAVPLRCKDRRKKGDLLSQWDGVGLDYGNGTRLFTNIYTL